MTDQTAVFRLFAGVPLSDECKAVSAELLQRLREPGGPLRGARVSCPPPEKQHLTLKFLGDTPGGRIESVLAVLGAVDFTPFALSLADAGFFPDMTRPRVLWAGVAQGAARLAALAARVNEALAPLGFAPEKRPYRAHLTLGRVREQGTADWAETRRMVAECAWPEMLVSRFVLWKSELGPGGPVYTPLLECPAEGTSRKVAL
ncbi:RNA 2',3'-cyclic phosphodiesterase [Paucidesulfovibrio longus]|uniref:RNA 2',3'-cyclic phosphodiesterase n=1 Tax=Paucidesulfovibrio longus TaxID=889 RepID=UPI0003B69CA1|nr:RNA 2',3'-cyclic phosphodiesterase [Paucidesulfovibrio longus]